MVAKAKALILIVLAGVLVLCSWLWTNGTAAAQAAGACWTQVARNLDLSDGTFSGIDAAAADDVWAVGAADGGPLAIHWNGSEWTKERVEFGGENGFLNDVAAISPDDAWAVGHQWANMPYDQQTLIMHWDGSSWRRVESPNPGSDGNQLDSIAAVSSNDIWVGGYSRDNSEPHERPILLHWDGIRWDQVSLAAHPDYYRISALGAVAANDVWAAGFGPGLLHWNGSTWTNVPVEGGDPSIWINSLAVADHDDIWATWATSEPAAGKHTLHWDGSKWTFVGVPSMAAGWRINLQDVAADGANVWAVGWAGANRAPDRLLLLRWNGAAWEYEQSPVGYPQTQLLAVAANGESAGAVGNSSNGSGLPGALTLALSAEACNIPLPLPSPVASIATPVALPGAGSANFPQTGQTLNGIFLEYWQEHGGLMQQGYPLSDEFVEISDVDGKPYTVQYFERSVYEYHPENAKPYDVLLSQLGRFQYNRKYNPAKDAPALDRLASRVGSVSAAGDYIFWVAEGTTTNRIYGYNIHTVSTFVVREDPGVLVYDSMASDGKILVWIDGSTNQLHGYDLAAGTTFTVAGRVDISLGRNNFAVENGIIYYVRQVGAGVGLVGHHIASGEEEVLVSREYAVDNGLTVQNVQINDVKIAGGMLVWTEQTYALDTLAQSLTLHVMKPNGGLDDTIVASGSGYVDYAAGDGLVAYAFSPANLNDLSDPSYRLHLYNTSTGATETVSYVAANNIVVADGRVVWVEGGYSINGQQQTAVIKMRYLGGSGNTTIPLQPLYPDVVALLNGGTTLVFTSFDDLEINHLYTANLR